MKKLFYVGIVFIILITIVISGCGKSKVTSGVNNITKEQVINIISSDLKHHGVNFKELAINKIYMDKTGTMATIDLVIVLEGGNKSETVTLIKEHGEWFIDGHNH